MIGFLVNQLFKRWWVQFQNIAFPDHLCYKLLAFAPSADARPYRRTVARYMNLAIVETLRSVSIKAAKRFPTHNDLVRCGERLSNAISEAFAW